MKKTIIKILSFPESLAGRKIKSAYCILLILNILTGIGAVAGGLAAILNPLEPLGAPVDALKNSPFEDYLIPGLVLFTVLGLGSLLCAAAILLKFKLRGYIGFAVGGAIIIWIVVQCIMLLAVAFLHVLFFFIGLIVAAMSMLMIFEERLFPADIILNILKTIRKKLGEEL